MKFSSREIVGLYLYLKDRDDLDLAIAHLCIRLEKRIQAVLSIGEFADLTRLYEKEPSFFDDKGLDA